MDFTDLCRSMNLISSLPEYTKPKNVALMFFNLEPEKFFPYAKNDVVQFPDGLGGDRIIEKTSQGHCISSCGRHRNISATASLPSGYTNFLIESKFSPVQIVPSAWKVSKTTSPSVAAIEIGESKSS